MYLKRTKQAALAEAGRLYDEAKRASFEGRLADAEQRHLASAVLFESTGEGDLAARAYLRAIWYRIQGDALFDFEETIDRAEALSPLQTAAGLHQALEFAMFEESEEAFDICRRRLEILLPQLNLKPPPGWSDNSKWGKPFARVGVDLYNAAMATRLSSGGEQWEWSDQARIFYFRAALTINDRCLLLTKAAELFESHNLLYRAWLCKAEGAIWTASDAPDSRAAQEQLSLAASYAAEVRSYSRGILHYRGIIRDIIDYGIFAVACLGRAESVEAAASREAGLVLLNREINGDDSKLVAQRILGLAREDETISSSQVQSCSLSWYRARLGGLTREGALTARAIGWALNRTSGVAHTTIEGTFTPKTATSQKYDVFVCYRHEDRDSVLEIATQLRSQGLTCWLDEWCVPPGHSWMTRFSADIGNIRSATVFFGKNGLSAWQTEEYEALLTQFLEANRPVIPVLLSEYPGGAIPALLRSRVAVDFRSKDSAALAKLAQGIRSAPPLPTT